MTLNKKQAADALYISLRTLERRMKAGVYKFTRGEGKWAEVSFTYADLGLPEPTPTPQYNNFGKEYDVPVPQPAKPAPKMRELSPIEKNQAADLAFAERYKMGDVTDSYGNDVNGSNKLCPTAGPQCGVKARDVDQSQPRETQSHMDPALLGDRDTFGRKHDTDFKMGTRSYYEQSQGLEPSCGFTKSGKPLAEGSWSADGRTAQEVYDSMLREHDRTCGKPSMSEQLEKILNDKARIRASFPKGNAATASRGLAR